MLPNNIFGGKIRTRKVAKTWDKYLSKNLMNKCGKFCKRFYQGLRTELEEIMREQGQDVPSRLKALKDRKKIIEGKMDGLEDQMISKTIPKERVEKKYIPLREELKSVEADIASIRKIFTKRLFA